MRSSSAGAATAARSHCASVPTGAATSSRSAAPTTAGRASAPRRSCGTSWPTSSAASGRPSSRARPRRPATPTFHEFASEWLESRRAELRPASIADYSWQLCNHLLPFFHRHRLPQITVAEVDRYREFKVREGLLGAGVDQQDDHAAGPDPRRRRGARPDRAQPGARQHAQPQAQDASGGAPCSSTRPSRSSP